MIERALMTLKFLFWVTEVDIGAIYRDSLPMITQ